jgi:hypothetical protein
MEIFITEYCKVERVEGGIAFGTFNIPVDVFDDVLSLVDHIGHASRVLKVKSRVAAAEIKQPISRFGSKNK